MSFSRKERHAYKRIAFVFSWRTLREKTIVNHANLHQSSSQNHRKLRFILFSICILFSAFLPAQVMFTAPDSVCAGELFAPVNQSRNASSYFWHFCSGNLNNPPAGTNLGNTGFLNGPAFIAIAEDSGKYYSFITNHLTRNITRNKLDSSLNNTPVADDLGTFGNMIPDHAEGIQVKKDNGNWYAFVVGGLGGDEKLVRLNFGNSLNNTPTATDFGNIGQLAYPVDLFLYQENGLWIGFTVNYTSSTITRFTFPYGLGNAPQATNLGNIGNLNNPCGICMFPENGNWYMFVTNLGSYSISRLNLGNSLLNTPAGSNLGIEASLDSPFDMTLIRDCGQTFGFVVNRNSYNLVRIDFSQGVTGPASYTNLGNIGGLNYPHGISDVYRDENELFMFIANIGDRSLTRLYYSMCNDPSILTSTQRNPSPLYYRHEGNYNITLILDQGLPTEELYCKNIVVLPKPHVALGNDTTICPHIPLTLDAGPGFQTYLWSDGSRTQTITTLKADTFRVEVTNDKGCKDRDTIVVSRFPDNLFLGNDTVFTLGEPIILDAGNDYKVYSWSTGENSQHITVIKPGDYAVTVTNVNNCNLSDSIRITLQVVLPNFFTPNGDGINDRWEPKLFVHYPEAEIKIFDRFGKLMASYRGREQGWDGNYNGRPAEPDTYWYVVDLKNGIKPITGQITIKR